MVRPDLHRPPRTRSPPHTSPPVPDCPRFQRLPRPAHASIRSISEPTAPCGIHYPTRRSARHRPSGRGAPGRTPGLRAARGVVPRCAAGAGAAQSLGTAGGAQSRASGGRAGAAAHPPEARPPSCSSRTRRQVTPCSNGTRRASWKEATAARESSLCRLAVKADVILTAMPQTARRHPPPPPTHSGCPPSGARSARSRRRCPTRRTGHR